jgi:small conductance mechanosensitive channel
MGNLLGTTASFFISGLVLVLLVGALLAVHRKLLHLYKDKPFEQYRRQLIMLGVSLFALIFAIVIMPVGDAMQGQLLSLLGIVLSATIALSSTTIVGNAMAGLMLKSLRKIRPGNFIHVGEHYGRVSEMDLLHTEIQTEERDLTTLPNLYLVTNPVRVLRDSGTVLWVEVSLGYDIPRKKVEAALCKAAEKAGLKNPYVQVRELRDFSVLYRVNGVTEDIEHLIGTRRKLRAYTLDELHEAQIEIVSPTFMNTRTVDPAARIIPRADKRAADSIDEAEPDAVVFDKAQQAESLDRLREARVAIQAQVEEQQTALKAVKDKESPEYADLAGKVEKLQAELAASEQQVTAAEALIAGQD